MTESELQQLRDRRTAYIAAETAIIGGAQEYTIGQGSTARRVRRADLSEIRAAIVAIDAQLAVGTPRRRGPFYLRPGC